jgi:hypothetical protein
MLVLKKGSKIQYKSSLNLPDLIFQQILYKKPTIVHDMHQFREKCPFSGYLK